jgi:Zn-dependent peptidase ImmA (M78 family)
MELKLKLYASELRRKAGYNSIEPVNFMILLKQLDVLTLFSPLSQDFSGLSIKEGHNRFMLINCNHSLGRQNFTIGHELYHLYFDKDFVPHKCNAGLFPARNANERLADIFASHLLLPGEGILLYIPEKELIKNAIKLPTLLKIEQTYCSSRKALLHQLSEMELISREYIDHFSLNVQSGARQYGYSLELYNPTVANALVGAYGSLANKLLEQDKISEGHFSELMSAIGIDINDTPTDEKY